MSDSVPADLAPTQGPFRILCVCVGNVCRSPVAERLLTRMLPADRFVVGSAGTGAMVGYAMSRYAHAELRALGGDPTGFAGRQLEAGLVTEADLVLTATRDLRSDLLHEVPEALRRSFTIREFAALADRADPLPPVELVRWASTHRSAAASELQDIADPFRRGAEAHHLAATQIHEAVTRIAAALTAVPQSA